MEVIWLFIAIIIAVVLLYITKTGATEVVWLFMAIIIAVEILYADLLKFIVLALIVYPTVLTIAFFTIKANAETPKPKVVRPSLKAAKTKRRPKRRANPVPNRSQVIPVERKNSLPVGQDDIVPAETEEPQKGEERGYVSQSSRGASKWPSLHRSSGFHLIGSRSALLPGDKDEESHDHVQPSRWREDHGDLEHSRYVKDEYRRKLPCADEENTKITFHERTFVKTADTLSKRSDFDEERRVYEPDFTESLENASAVQWYNTEVELMEKEGISHQAEIEEDTDRLSEQEDTSRPVDNEETALWMANHRAGYIVTGSCDAILEHEDERSLEQDDKVLLQYLDNADLDEETESTYNNAVADETSSVCTDEELIEIGEEMCDCISEEAIEVSELSREDDCQSSLQESETYIKAETSSCNTAASCANITKCNDGKSEESNSQDERTHMETSASGDLVNLEHKFDSIVYCESLISVDNEKEFPENDGEFEVNREISDGEGSYSSDAKLGNVETEFGDQPQNNDDNNDEESEEMSDDDGSLSVDEGIDSMQSNECLTSMDDWEQPQETGTCYEKIDEKTSSDDGLLDLDIGNINDNSSQSIFPSNEQLQRNDEAANQLLDGDECFGNIEGRKPWITIKYREQMQENVVSVKHTDREQSIFEDESDGDVSVNVYHRIESADCCESFNSINGNEQFLGNNREAGDEVIVGISEYEDSRSTNGGIDSMECNTHLSFDEGIYSMESKESLISIDDTGQSQKVYYRNGDENVLNDHGSLELDGLLGSSSNSQSSIPLYEHVQGNDEYSAEKMPDGDEGFGNIEGKESLTVKERKQLKENGNSCKEVVGERSLLEGDSAMTDVGLHDGTVELRDNGDTTLNHQAVTKVTQTSEIITIWYKCQDTGKQTSVRLTIPPQTEVTAVQIGDDNIIVMEDSPDEGYGSLESSLDDADGSVEDSQRKDAVKGNETEFDISHTLDIGPETVLKMEVSARELVETQAGAERLLQELKKGTLTLNTYEGERTGTSGNEDRGISHKDQQRNMEAFDSSKEVCKTSFVKVLPQGIDVVEVKSHPMTTQMFVQVDEGHIWIKQVLSMKESKNIGFSGPPALFIQLGGNNVIVRREKKYVGDNRLRRLTSLHGLRSVRDTDRFLLKISVSVSEDLLARIVDRFFMDKTPDLPTGGNEEECWLEITQDSYYLAGTSAGDQTVEREGTYQGDDPPDSDGNQELLSKRKHTTVNNITPTSESCYTLCDAQPKREEPFSSQTRQVHECVSSATTGSFSTEYLGSSSQDRRKVGGDERHDSPCPDLTCCPSSRRRSSECSFQGQSSAGLKRVKMKLLSEVNDRIVSTLLEYSDNVQKLFEMLGIQVVAISRSAGVLTCRSDSLNEVVQRLMQTRSVIDNLWLAIIRGLEVRDGIHVMDHRDVHSEFWLERQQT